MVHTSSVVFAMALAAACALCVFAAPLDDSKHATVLRYENDNIGLDGYKFA